MKKISDFMSEVEDYYFINEVGDVFSSKSNKILSKKIDKGYYRVGLKTKTGKQKLYSIARIVCFCYKKLIKGKEYVDHINRNKIDNRVENLRWCTMSENNSNRDGSVSIKNLGKYGKIFNYKITINEVEFIGTAKEIRNKFNLSHKKFYNRVYNNVIDEIKIETLND